MMDRTDRHCRFLFRQLSRHILLYTEMLTTGAVLHGNRARLLGFSPQEQPLVLQLGGDDPAALAECAHIAQEEGYTEVNLNCGCPSDRVQSGSFGAIQMKNPQAVAECISRMKARTTLPVTVKHRIGVDEFDRYEHMHHFVVTVAEAGCDGFIIHARKAWLKGLSPKENREVPPLRYDDVYRLKREYPALHIEINGGIQTLAEVQHHLEHVDGVMIGRALYQAPYLLAYADRDIFDDTDAPIPTRYEIVARMIPYAEARLEAGEPLSRITRHMLMLFGHQMGARAWRRHLSQEAWTKGAGSEVIRQACQAVKVRQTTRETRPAPRGDERLEVP